MTAYAEVWLDLMPPACLTPSHPSNEGGPGDSLEGTCLGTCLLSSHHEDTHRQSHGVHLFSKIKDLIGPQNGLQIQEVILKKINKIQKKTKPEEQQI